MTNNVIQTSGLTKKFGGLVAVDHMDLSVEAGEIFGFLGPNGAGKTTTLLMFLGLTEPTSGKVRIVGFDPAREPLRVKEKVGYLPENVGFFSVHMALMIWSASSNCSTRTRAGGKS